MTDTDELLSKADALLARWRSGVVVPRPPADYPLLTEVVKAWAADSGARMPEIPDEPDIPVLDASSAVPAASPAVPIEIPVLDSPEAPTLDAPSSPAAADAALSTFEAADELPHLPPLEASPASADAATVALEERVRLRVLEAIEPYICASLDEPLRLRIEELARRLAENISRDARNDILTLVRVAVQSAVARELDARRDERSGDR
jgi:hypothetical protein